MMKDYIRNMEIDDCHFVARIEEEIFSLPWSEKSFADACSNKDNIYLVCEVEGKVAGYLGVWGSFDEGNITNVAVSPEYRRQGICRALFEKLWELGKEKNITSFFLEVRAGNIPAISLYESMGFKMLGVRKGFYEKPVEDALVLSRSIE